jgi:predicted secreted protein
MRKHHLAMLGLLVVFFGCSDSSAPTEIQLDSSVNGKDVLFPLNQTFTLELDLNADGGYQWDHSLSDTAVIHLDSTTYRQKGGGPIVPGGLTVETFCFRTTRIGKCTVNLIEHQAWLPDVPPIHSVQFVVSVYP